MDVQQGGSLTYCPVHCDSQNIMGEDDIMSALKSSIDVKVVASVITVNGRPAVALRTEAEAQQAKEAVLVPYRNVTADRYRTGIGFVEDVQVQQMPINFSLVQPYDQAVRILTLGSGVDDNIYVVKKGDTLGKIAKKFSLKISDIRRANPQMLSNVIQPGQTLNAVKPASWVNVRYTEQIKRQEVLPFKVVEQPDDKLFTTQTDVKQEGRNGLCDVWAKVTYVNGIEADEEMLNQPTVITPAQDKIVLKGTKKVPTNAGGGSGTVSGKYIVPLKYAYRISGTFGPRNLAGAAGNYHYGEDLAAPTGTPIYASRAGTITKAGSGTGYGLVVYIDHGSGVSTRYGHCSKILVKNGQKVNQGDIIALVGATGDATGPHLHFEIRINGTAVNPTKYMRF
jgi:murein DD-endopeptidase MepM/ murein hydrolase activator NlpD